MDNVKINRNTPVSVLTRLNVVDMVEKDGELVVKLGGKECYAIDEGETVRLRRFIKGENGVRVELNEDLVVKHEDDEHFLHIELPDTEKIFIRQDDIAVREVTGYTGSEAFSYHIIECSDFHNIFAQDLAINATQEIYLRNSDGELISTCQHLYIPSKYSDNIVTSADCISVVSEEDACGKNYDRVYLKKYEFLPERFHRYALIVSGATYGNLKEALYFEKKFNPYYYYTIESDEYGNPTELDSFGNPIRHCFFYEDNWWSWIRWAANEVYVNCGETISELALNTDFYNVGMALCSDADESTLGTEDYFSETYAKMIEDSLIPDVVDMERVKYSPRNKIPKNGGGFAYEIITGITMYPHFRKRKMMVTDLDRKKNAASTSGNVYFDSWEIDPESASTIWWNYYSNSDVWFDSVQFSAWCWSTPNGRAYNGDLLGHLNFTDKDVYYRKRKISKSFFRLSFYNSRDPIEQKLLYYSTVFLDGTSYYGKYMKQTEKDYENNSGYSGNSNTIGVFYEGDRDKMLEVKLHVTNEYGRDSSAEGFNIYLFADDAPKGNAVKTIYMKVEFNHAGNGKTIPLIIWPRKGNTDWGLTIDNFLENLYIPIEISEVDGQYIYVVKGGKCENGHLEIPLFEPKLDTDNEG